MGGGIPFSKGLEGLWKRQASSAGSGVEPLSKTSFGAFWAWKNSFWSFWYV